MKKILLTIILCCIPVVSTALSEGYKASLRGEMYYLLNRHPKIIYKWGGTDIYEGNSGDCSGTFYAIGKKLGWNIQRITSKDMEAGLGNWKNRQVALDKAEETTIVWWSWGLKDYKEGKGKAPKRPHGHIGMLMISPKSGLLEVVHNNLSKGLHMEPLQNALMDDLSSIKNLTLGEEQKVILGRGVIRISPDVKK